MEYPRNRLFFQKVEVELCSPLCSGNVSEPGCAQQEFPQWRFNLRCSNTEPVL